MLLSKYKIEESKKYLNAKLLEQNPPKAISEEGDSEEDPFYTIQTKQS